MERHVYRSAWANMSAKFAAKLRRHDRCPEDGRDTLAADNSEYLSGVVEVDRPAEVRVIGDSSLLNIIADGPMLMESPAGNYLFPG